MKKTSLLSHNSETSFPLASPSTTTDSFPLASPSTTTDAACHEEDPSTPTTPPGIQHRGWYSERVPLPNNKFYSTDSIGHHHQQLILQRHASSVALLPFNSARRSGLPSKWDDAGRWISSPTILGGGGGIHSKSNQNLLLLPRSERHAKSKSGPLGSNFSSFVYYDDFSPGTPSRHIGVGNGAIRKFNSIVVDSPVECDGRRSCPGAGVDQEDLACARDWLKMIHHEPSSPFSQDERFCSASRDGEMETVDCANYTREIAIEISDKGCSSNSLSPLCPQSDSSSPKAGIKDVQVDRSTSIRLSRDYDDRFTRNSSCRQRKDSQTNNGVDMKLMSPKLEREQRKISAWENAQKAKTEAAIHRLEMKLEKERSASMGKIMTKLTRAERKAQKMRNRLLSDGNGQHSKSSGLTVYKFNCSCKCFGISSSVRNFIAY